MPGADLRQPQHPEAVPQHRAGGLGGVAGAPVGAAEPVAELGGGVGGGEAGHADEGSGVAARDRPDPFGGDDVLEEEAGVARAVGVGHAGELAGDVGVAHLLDDGGGIGLDGEAEEEPVGREGWAGEQRGLLGRGGAGGG